MLVIMVWKDGKMVAECLNENVRQYRKAIKAALDELRPHLTVGMWIEDKYATASVHYRMTPRPDQVPDTLKPLIDNIVNRYGLKFSEGRYVFEIRPPIETNKGTALAEIVEEHNLEAVIYLGDDLTDVDAMKMARQLREIETCQAIAVGVIPEQYPPDLTTHYR